MTFGGTSLVAGDGITPGTTLGMLPGILPNKMLLIMWKITTLACPSLLNQVPQRKPTPTIDPISLQEGTTRGGNPVPADMAVEGPGGGDVEGGGMAILRMDHNKGNMNAAQEGVERAGVEGGEVGMVGEEAEIILVLTLMLNLVRLAARQEPQLSMGQV